MAPECKAGARSNGWIMLGKTYIRLVFHSHGGRDPKTGQVGGLPSMMCCNAPYHLPSKKSDEMPNLNLSSPLTMLSQASACCCRSFNMLMVPLLNAHNSLLGMLY